MNRIAKPLTVILVISIQLSASVLSTYSDANALRPPAAKPKGGMLDTTFGSSKNGKVITSIGIDVDVVTALVIQPDGKIVVAGRSYNTGSASLDFVVARYASTGVLDETFGTGGKVTTSIGNANDEIYAIALQPDGKIVVAGSSTNNGFFDFALARYTSAGVLDDTFGADANGKVTTPIGSNNDEIYAMALQPDGKIVVAGYSDNGGFGDFALARYTSAGVLDTTFGANATGIIRTQIGSNHDQINALILQPDGKIVVAGKSYNGANNDFALARYTSAGVLDTTFGTNANGKITTQIGSYNDEIFAMVLQHDGKIVVGGKSYNGANNDFALARYTSAGVLDTTFGANANGKVITPIDVASEVYALALQPDGKILAAGYSYYNFDHNFALARYTSAGVLDSTFGTSGITKTVLGDNEDMIKALALQADGKIVVAGYSIRNNDYDFALARYTNDLDPLTQAASFFIGGRGGLVS